MCIVKRILTSFSLITCSVFTAFGFSSSPTLISVSAPDSVLVGQVFDIHTTTYAKEDISNLTIGYDLYTMHDVKVDSYNAIMGAIAVGDSITKNYTLTISNNFGGYLIIYAHSGDKSVQNEYTVDISTYNSYHYLYTVGNFKENVMTETVSPVVTTTTYSSPTQEQNPVNPDTIQYYEYADSNPAALLRGVATVDNLNRSGSITLQYEARFYDDAAGRWEEVEGVRVTASIVYDISMLGQVLEADSYILGYTDNNGYVDEEIPFDNDAIYITISLEWRDFTNDVRIRNLNWLGLAPGSDVNKLQTSPMLTSEHGFQDGGTYNVQIDVNSGHSRKYANIYHYAHHSAKFIRYHIGITYPTSVVVEVPSAIRALEGLQNYCYGDAVYLDQSNPRHYAGKVVLHELGHQLMRQEWGDAWDDRVMGVRWDRWDEIPAMGYDPSNWMYLPVTNPEFQAFSEGFADFFRTQMQKYLSYDFTANDPSDGYSESAYESPPSHNSSDARKPGCITAAFVDLFDRQVVDSWNDDLLAIKKNDATGSYVYEYTYIFYLLNNYITQHPNDDSPLDSYFTYYANYTFNNNYVKYYIGRVLEDNVSNYSAFVNLSYDDISLSVQGDNLLGRQDYIQANMNDNVEVIGMDVDLGYKNYGENTYTFLTEGLDLRTLRLWNVPITYVANIYDPTLDDNILVSADPLVCSSVINHDIIIDGNTQYIISPHNNLLIDGALTITTYGSLRIDKPMYVYGVGADPRIIANGNIYISDQSNTYANLIVFAPFPGETYGPRIVVSTRENQPSVIKNATFRNSRYKSILLRRALTEPIENVKIFDAPTAIDIEYLDAEQSIIDCEIGIDVGEMDKGISLHSPQPHLVTVQENAFLNVSQASIYVQGSDVDINHNRILNESLDNWSHGIELSSSDGSIRDNVVYGASTGILLSECAPNVSGNTLNCKGRDLRTIHSAAVLRTVDASPGLNRLYSSYDTNIALDIMGRPYPIMNNGYNMIFNNPGWVMSAQLTFGPNWLPLPWDSEQFTVFDNYWGYPSYIWNNIDHENIYQTSTGSWYHGIIRTDLGMIEDLYTGTSQGQVDITTYPRYSGVTVADFFDQPGSYDDMFNIPSNCTSCHPSSLFDPEPPAFNTVAPLSQTCVGGSSYIPENVWYESLQDAIDYLSEDDYTNASVELEDILNNCDDTNLRQIAIQKLRTVDRKSLNYSAINIMGSVADTTSNDLIRVEAGYALAYANQLEGNFSNAVLFYETMAKMGYSSKLDSIRAVRNIAQAYLASALTNQQADDDPDLALALANTPLLGNDAERKPLAKSSCEESIHALQNELTEKFSIASYSIDSVVKWSWPLIELEQDLIIAGNGKLVIEPGCIVDLKDYTIEVEGQLIASGDPNLPITFSSRNGQAIILQANSSIGSVLENCVFNDALTAIEVKIGLTQSFSNLTFNNCTVGIRTKKDYPIELVAESCLFSSTRTFTDLGFDLAKLQSGSLIDACTFKGAMRPIVALNSDFKVSNCYVDNTDTLTTTSDRSAFDLTYCSGMIAHNSILRYPTGIKLYDSDMIVTENKIEECFQEGVWLQHDSYPEFCSMNWLNQNGGSATIPAQMRIEGEIYPYMKNGDNNLWVAKNGYAIVSGTASSSYTELGGNYWGDSNPDPQDLFYPYSTKLNIYPWLTSQQVPSGGYQTASIFEDLYSQALACMATSEYEEAIDCFEQVALNDTTTGLRVGAVSNLLTAYRRSETPYCNLFQFLNTIAETTQDFRVRLEANNTIARANREMAEYQAAIGHYESIILDPTTLFEDSIFAVIDAGYAYLEAAANGNGKRSDGGEVFGEIAELRPLNRAVQDQKVAMLMSLLRNRSYSIAERVELPEEFVLQPAYPNPFNPTVTIPFGLPASSKINVVVYNVLGQHIVTLVDGIQQAGYHRVVWDGRSASGTPLSSGVYFIKMEAPHFVKTRKIVMLK